jgi:type II secretory pathway pseudopilin PulG
MIPTPYSNRGFTIIELLVAIGIIMIVVGMVITGYSRYNQRQTLISSALVVKNMIRDAQSRAYNGEVDRDSCDWSLGSSRSLNGWYVDFGNKTIYGECRAPGPGNPLVTFYPQQFNLPEITIIPHITPAVNPKVLFRYSPPSIDQKGTFCITSSNMSSNYYLIYVNQAGAISDSGDIIQECTPAP